MVPSISLMFGYNAGGGAYLPRQGSFMIQCDDTFIGLTGPGVVKSVLGEDVTADDLGGPGVHGQSGVCDLVTPRRARLAAHGAPAALLPARQQPLASALPETSDPVDRHTGEEDLPLPPDLRLAGRHERADGHHALPAADLRPRRVLRDPAPARAQPDHRLRPPRRPRRRASSPTTRRWPRARSTSHAALKGTRFIRFCNLYNIPLIFIEDTTGFLPGTEQERNGIILAGRKLLDAIIDVRTPRMTMIIRNAFGGAYASYNSHFTGADLVFAMPMARIAVMGPAGKDFVYKDELRAIAASYEQALADGAPAADAAASATQALAAPDHALRERADEPEGSAVASAPSAAS